MTPRILALALVAVPLLSGQLHGQEPLSRDEAMRFARAWGHGVESLPADTIRRVVADAHTLRLYADALSGRSAPLAESDPATMLFFLSESEDPSFTRVFLQFATPGPTDYAGASYLMAVRGLARRASDPLARERISLLVHERRRDYAYSALNALVAAHTNAARDLLRTVPLERLPQALRTRVEAELEGSGGK